ncbi:hypothetical protein JVU11DRAFT_3070 [Chiua virens]|nr:hypothetical protein JVU11DRAFT_11864 [Chiua virens]KAG9315458.1 hypothetical protein JVU11DRAFT_3070 [Chiua virens]
MGTVNIPLDKAELLSTFLEAVLYGFSLLMFGGTIWALLARRSTVPVNPRMLAVACMLLFLSTVHLVIDIIRIMEGFALSRDPAGYFFNVSHWTFVTKNYVYAGQTVIGDAVILYRCHAVWQSMFVMVLPVLLWCGAAVAAFVCPYVESIATQEGVFGGTLSNWIISFFTLTLATNFLTTCLLAYRIWYVDRKTAIMRGQQPSQLMPMLHIIVDAGVIYSLTLFAALICFVNESNGQYVILNVITPIISITFYMVIIRVGLSHWVNQSINSIHQHRYHSSISGSYETNRRSRLTQHHVSILNETKLDIVPHSPTSLTTAIGCGGNRNAV